MSWEMAESYEWGLDIFRQEADPVVDCIGCSGSARIPISPEVQGQPGEAL